MKIRMKETAESSPHVNYVTNPITYNPKLFTVITV